MSPKHDFSCQDCSSLFEKSLSFQEFKETVIVCPECSSEKVRKTFEKIGRITQEKTEWDSNGEYVTGTELKRTITDSEDTMRRNKMGNFTPGEDTE